MSQTETGELKSPESAGTTTKSKILQALESKDLNVQFTDALDNEMVLNMGPQHPGGDRGRLKAPTEQGAGLAARDVLPGGLGDI